MVAVPERFERDALLGHRANLLVVLSALRGRVPLLVLAYEPDLVRLPSVDEVWGVGRHQDLRRGWSLGPGSELAREALDESDVQAVLRLLSTGAPPGGDQEVDQVRSDKVVRLRTLLETVRACDPRDHATLQRFAIDQALAIGAWDMPRRLTTEALWSELHTRGRLSAGRASTGPSHFAIASGS